MNIQSTSGPIYQIGKHVDRAEKAAIAVLLGLMTVVTFVNVVLRYVFNASIIWGLEVTLVLFAWLVLFGISYCVKITAHLGVDIVLSALSGTSRRVLALFSAAICLAYALLLLKGAWDYWAPFAGLYETTGRWFPTGFDPTTRDQAWYETDRIPMLDFLRFIEPIFNEGEAYEKLPRFIPYVILPVGVALLLFRLIQATCRIAAGRAGGLIVSHELEDGDNRES